MLAVQHLALLGFQSFEWGLAEELLRKGRSSEGSQSGEDRPTDIKYKHWGNRRFS